MMGKGNKECELPIASGSPLESKDPEGTQKRFSATTNEILKLDLSFLSNGINCASLRTSEKSESIRLVKTD